MNGQRVYCRRGLCFGLCSVLLLAAFVSGCTSPARFTPSSPAEKFPPYEGEVRVLQRLPNAGQFERVGVVVVEGVQLTAEEAMMDAARKKAAQNGANAVVMQGPIQVTKDSAGGITQTLAVWAIRLKR